jgi:hypothetical protein
VGSVERFQQFGGFDVQRASQGNDIQESDVAFAAFDPAHVVAMQVRQFRQSLLGEAPFGSEPAQVYPEHGSGIGGSHPAMIEALTTMSLHTMSVIK